MTPPCEVMMSTLPHEAGGAEPLFQPAEIDVHRRLQRRIDGRRHRPAVLADRRVDAVRERVWDAGQVFLDEPSDGKLMLGVDDRPEEADRDRFDPQLREPLKYDDCGSFIERHLDRTVDHDALGYLEGQSLRHIGFRVRRLEVESLRSPALAEDQRVRVSLRRKERGPCRRAGDDCIDRVGGAMNEDFPARQIGG